MTKDERVNLLMAQVTIIESEAETLVSAHLPPGSIVPAKKIEGPSLKRSAERLREASKQLRVLAKELRG